MSATPSKTNVEARRLAALTERITGEWYCQSGHHYTKATQLTWRGRRICARCKTRLQPGKNHSEATP
jgi:hypothetical protein